MDIFQGSLPSCQTLSSICALSLNKRGKTLLEQMVKETQSGYTVSFPGCDAPVTVLQSELVTQFDAQNQPQTVQGDTLVKVLELAYARHLKTLSPEKYASVPDDSIHQVYRSPQFHYRADISMHDLSGWKVDTLIANGGEIPEESSSFAQEKISHPEVFDSMLKMLELLASNGSDYVATVCTVGQPGVRMLLDRGRKLHPWHDHTLEKVDWANQRIGVIDPMDSRVTLFLKLDDFSRFFNLISVAKTI